MTAFTRFLTVGLFTVLLASPVFSQNQTVRLASIGTQDTLSSDTDFFVVAVGGMASLRLQTLDSYSGTWEVQCSVDRGTTYDADDELNLFLEGGSASAVQEVTDTVGVWTAGVAGCTHIKVIATAGFAASDVTIAVVAIASGGSASGGGGGGTVEIAEGGNTAQVTATSGGSLQVECSSGCGGSGGSSIADDAALTPAVTSVTALAGFADEVSPDSVNEGDAGAVRMSLNRNLYTVLRDAAGNERGANINASNQLAVTGPVTAVSGAFASGSFASGAIASGAIASGAIASGAIAAGAFATGATSVAADEDSAHTTADRGLKSLVAVQTASPADAASAADYSFLQMASGRLWTSTNGNLTHNGAAAGGDRVGVLPAVVEDSPPSLTDGRNAALSLTTGGSMRVMVSTASGAAATLSEDATHDAAATSTGPQGMAYAAAFGTLQTAVTAGDAVRAMSDLQGAAYVRSPTDPCDGVAKSYYVINTSSAASFEVANSSGSNHWYICAVNVAVGAAQGFLIAEDDTDGCGSITAGLNGGTTGATGWQFAANGGIALGNGTGAVLRSGTGGRYLCIVTSTTAQTSGTIAYVSAP